MSDAIAILKSADSIQRSNVSLLKQANETLLSQEALDRRRLILERGDNIEQVSGEASQKLAAAMLAEVNGELDAAEKSRKAVKDPFFRMGQRIDTDTKDYCGPLETLKSRLKKLLSDFQVAVERKAQAAGEARQKELDRIAAEQKKLEAQPVTKATIAKQEVLNQQAGKALVIHEAPKVEGMRVRKVWNVEVIDVEALYRTHPEFVSLSANIAGIKSWLTETEGKLKLPGVLFSQEVVVNARL